MKTASILLIFARAMISFAQKSDLESVVRGNTDFAIDIYQEIQKESGNILFSPYCISSEKELYITDALHKAFIEVDEAGTEAAAATAVVVAVTSAHPIKEAPVFKADHPFLFLFEII